jgi:hydrogenase maturation protease
MKTADNRRMRRERQSVSISEPRPASRSQRAERAALLVIGYGNELRSDDGVGARVAATVAEWRMPGVHAIVCHQLTPELAEPIAAADSVVFVDASLNGEISVGLCKIEPTVAAETMAHAANPWALLCLAETLFCHCPSAYWLTIPIDNVAFGNKFSPLAEVGFQIALRKIRLLAAKD